MSQRVRAADGLVHEFPDDATPEMIQQALGLSTSGSAAMDPAPAATPAAGSPSLSAAPPQLTGPARVASLAENALVRGAIHGLALPADLLDLTTRGANIARTAFGATPDQLFDLHSIAPWLPTSSNMLGWAGKAGLVDRADAIPGWGEHPEAEKLASAAGEGAGTMLPYAATGPGGVIAKILGNTGFGAVTGLVGEAVNQLTGSPAASLVAGGGAGLGAQGIISRVGQAMNIKSLTQAVSGAEELLASSRGDLSAAQVANAQAARDAQAGAKLTAAQNQQQLLANKGVLKTALDSQVSAHQASADALLNMAAAGIESVAQDHGASSTIQQAGTAMQEAARDWRNRVMPEKLESLWQPINGQMADASSGLPAFSSALADINKSAGALEPLAQVLKPGLPKALGDRLTAMTDLAGTAPSFSWPDVQALRSTLGNAMSDPKMISDIGQQNLSRLYATLTQDMRQAAQSKGPDALKAFDDANTASSHLYSLAEGPMSKIIAGPKADLAADPTPERVAQSLLASGARGGTDLAAIRAEIPDAVNELAAAHLRQGGAQAWQKLAPEAREALVPDAWHRAALDSAGDLMASTPQLRDQAIAEAKQKYRDAVALEAARFNGDTQQARDTAAKLVADAHQDTADKRLAVGSARNQLTGAQAQLGKAQPVNLQNEAMVHLLSALTAGEGLGSLVALIGHHVGLETLASHYAGHLMGLAAPSLYRGAKDLLTNPESWRLPILGADAAGNALEPHPPMSYSIQPPPRQ